MVRRIVVLGRRSPRAATSRNKRPFARHRDMRDCDAREIEERGLCGDAAPQVQPIEVAQILLSPLGNYRIQCLAGERKGSVSPGAKRGVDAGDIELVPRTPGLGFRTKEAENGQSEQDQ